MRAFFLIISLFFVFMSINIKSKQISITTKHDSNTIKKEYQSKIQYKIGINNSAVSPIVIIELAIILLFSLFSKYRVAVLVATASKTDTKIDFKNGLNNSTIKNIITIAIATKK